MKAGEPFRLLGADVDPLDTRPAWALAAERDEALHGLRRALEDRLDAPVRVIPHPAGHAGRLGATSRRLAEEDALDTTLDDNATSLHRLYRKAS